MVPRPGHSCEKYDFLPVCNFLFACLNSGQERGIMVATSSTVILPQRWPDDAGCYGAQCHYVKQNSCPSTSVSSFSLLLSAAYKNNHKHVLSSLSAVPPFLLCIGKDNLLLFLPTCQNRYLSWTKQKEVMTLFAGFLGPIRPKHSPLQYVSIAHIRIFLRHVPFIFT